MKEGERIHVKSKSFKGMATILYIAPGEFYPVQVEMDQPDEDGHKIQRITWVEIIKQSEEVKPSSKASLLRDAMIRSGTLEKS